jgi:hypothetical protein
MTVPEDTKDRAIYHTVLSDMHRLQAIMLNLQTIDSPDTEKSLREHFGRERSLVLARLSEWKQRRPAIYQQAGEDFKSQIKTPTE